MPVDWNVWENEVVGWNRKWSGWLVGTGQNRFLVQSTHNPTTRGLQNVKKQSEFKHLKQAAVNWVLYFMFQTCFMTSKRLQFCWNGAHSKGAHSKCQTWLLIMAVQQTFYIYNLHRNTAHAAHYVCCYLIVFEVKSHLPTFPNLNITLSFTSMTHLFFISCISFRVS